MRTSEPATPFRTDLLLLCAIASVVLILHFIEGNGYGFHRDEFQFLHDARNLDFGFVPYPPMTSLFGRLSIALFGISVAALRLPSAIVCSVCVVLIGLTARELGARKPAQALAAALALPLAIAFGSTLMYNTPDWLAWCATIFCTARLLRTQDARWWLGIGAAIGFGVESKYSIAFLAISLLAGVAFLPSQRHALRSRWFYLGIAALLFIAAPNLVWLVKHHFITIRMEQFIHARDIRLGRTQGYYLDQLKYLNLALPLTLAGIVWLLRNKTFRLLAFAFLGPFLLFALAKGRGYYLLVAYACVWPAGAVYFEEWLSAMTARKRIAIRSLQTAALLCSITFMVCMYAPISHTGASLWEWQMKNNGDMRDEIGWPELAAEVAAVRDSLTPAEQHSIAVLAINYGEAGALELFGPQYHLPAPISHVNSWQALGLPQQLPDTVIAVGYRREWLADSFASCTLASNVTNPYGVHNEESEYAPYIWICRRHVPGWREMWPTLQGFG